MKSIKVIGPFITNYSIARVNRGLSKAMSEDNSEYSVKLFQDKDKIDKWPDENDLKKFPYIRSLWSKDDFKSDIVIYSDFPKEGIVPLGLKNLDTNCIIPYIAWEETVYPKIWVEEINQYAHGVAVISSFVKDTLFSNGIKVPIKVVDIGIDDAMRVNPSARYELNSKAKFNFLHVSSARARKGVDILIKAFCEEFSKDDDVALIIKSFPGPDNQVEELIAKYSNENCAPIEHLTSPDITDQDMVNLIHTCDCGVYPSRAEGFGLPIAEAMLHKIPVITTNYSGQLDFASEDNAFLLDYTLENAVDSEMSNPGSKWAEPDESQLKKYMRDIYLNKDSIEIKSKIELAHEAASKLTWKSASTEMSDFVDQIQGVVNLKNKNLAVITPFNSDDGIAEYTYNLISRIENSFLNTYYLINKDYEEKVSDSESDSIIPCWEPGETDFTELLNVIKDREINLVHIQYHSGVNFPVSGLDKLISVLKSNDIKVFVTLHSVISDSFNIRKESTNLQNADGIFVHNAADKTALNLKNTVLFTLPKEQTKRRNKKDLQAKLGIKSSLVISTHGKLVLRKSDILEVIRAVEILKNDYPDILYLAINAVVSSNSVSQSDYEKCVKLIEDSNLEKNVIFIKDFLSTQQVYTLLQASDCAIFPYNDVGESASAAVSKSLAAGVTTIVTNIKMFSEFHDCVYKIKDLSDNTIANAVLELLSNAELKSRINKSADEFIEKNSFSTQALKTLQIYQNTAFAN